MKILTLIPRIVIAAIKVIGKKLKGSKPIKDVEKSLSKDDKAKDFFDTVINKSAKVDHKHRKKYIADAILGIAGTATLLGAKHIKEHGIGPFEALKRFSNSIHDKKTRSEVEKIIEKIDKVPEVSKFLEEKKTVIDNYKRNVPDYKQDVHYNEMCRDIQNEYINLARKYFVPQLSDKEKKLYKSYIRSYMVRLRDDYDETVRELRKKSNNKSTESSDNKTESSNERTQANPSTKIDDSEIPPEVEKKADVLDDALDKFVDAITDVQDQNICVNSEVLDSVNKVLKFNEEDGRFYTYLGFMPADFINYLDEIIKILKPFQDTAPVPGDIEAAADKLEELNKRKFSLFISEVPLDYYKQMDATNKWIPLMQRKLDEYNSVISKRNELNDGEYDERYVSNLRNVVNKMSDLVKFTSKYIEMFVAGQDVIEACSSTVSYIHTEMNTTYTSFHANNEVITKKDKESGK